MSDLRILVVENQPNWQEELRQTLQRLGGDVQIDVAPDYSVALQHANRESYDLATVDLALLVEPADPAKSDQLGLELLRELRNSRNNRGCGLIVLSGYATKDRTRLAFRDYNADDVIDKNDFDEDLFIAAARATILKARLRQATARDNARYRLTVIFGQETLMGSELIGPDRRAGYTFEHPPHLEVADLARRADNLNILVLKGGVDVWRPEARSIGNAIYQVLAGERRILGDLTAARALAQRFSDLWLQFSGPALGLGIPFELLRDEDDYLALNHILTRRVVQVGAGFSRKFEPFHKFLEGLLEDGEPLRVLLVGANCDGSIPAVEVETASLAVDIRTDLQRLGIAHEITLLSGATATYANVNGALRDGRYHLFHYAGHGRYDDKLPEISGLVLRDSNDLRTLTAAELSLLIRDTKLRMVFLSCCLGARTASQAGRGDFYGALEALSRADVPLVLGYRWTVADTPAMLVAQGFYKSLWRTFSPGEALLEARRNAAMGEHGRDDETWASPVLLMQNS